LGEKISEKVAARVNRDRKTMRKPHFDSAPSAGQKGINLKNCAPFSTAATTMLAAPLKTVSREGMTLRVTLQPIDPLNLGKNLLQSRTNRAKLLPKLRKAAFSTYARQCL